MQLRTVLDVKVVDVEKRRHPSKHYVSGACVACLFILYLALFLLKNRSRAISFLWPVGPEEPENYRASMEVTSCFSNAREAKVVRERGAPTFTAHLGFKGYTM